MKLATIVTRMSEAEARKSVVLDILSFEKNTLERRRYRAELNRIKKRISDYQFALIRGARISQGISVATVCAVATHYSDIIEAVGHFAHMTGQMQTLKIEATQ